MSVNALLRSTGDVRAIVDSAAGAKYLPGGHLVYESDGRLFAATFDATTLEKGQSRAVVPDIGRTRFGGSWRQSSRGRPYDISATARWPMGWASAPCRASSGETERNDDTDHAGFA